jgi:hypothetical protein
MQARLYAATLEKRAALRDGEAETGRSKISDEESVDILFE